MADAVVMRDHEITGAANAEFAPGLGRAEVDWLAREEWARTADDILWRRSKRGLSAPPEAATALTVYLGASATDEFLEST